MLRAEGGLDGTHPPVLLRIAGNLALGSFSVAPATAATVTVDCTHGQTITAALAKLNPKRPNTVNVLGTCVETVTVRNVEQLTLSGTGGGAIIEPLDQAPELSIVDSHAVVVRNLTVGWGSAARALVVGNCVDCELRDSTIDGWTLQYGASYVLFLKDVLRERQLRGLRDLR